MLIFVIVLDLYNAKVNYFIVKLLKKLQQQKIYKNDFKYF